MEDKGLARWKDTRAWQNEQGLGRIDKGLGKTQGLGRMNKGLGKTQGLGRMNKGLAE